MRGFALIGVCLVHVLGVWALVHDGPSKQAAPVQVLMRASLLPGTIREEAVPLPTRKLKKTNKTTPLASQEATPVDSSNSVAADDVQSDDPAEETTNGTQEQPSEADYRFNPAPDYPPLSRRMQEEGRVLLKVHVAEDGHALEMQIETSSGFARLDRAAVSAVQTWQFEPAQRDGRPVPSWVLVPILFRLKGP